MVRPSVAESKPCGVTDNRHADLVAENARLRVAMCALEDRLISAGQKTMDMQRDSIVRRQEFEALLADELSRAIENIKTVISQRDDAREERDDARRSLALSVQNLRDVIAQRDEARRLLHELHVSTHFEESRFLRDSLHKSKSASRELPCVYDDDDDDDNEDEDNEGEDNEDEEEVVVVEEAKRNDDHPEAAHEQSSKLVNEERAALIEGASRREALLCSVVERLEANIRGDEKRHTEALLTAAASATAEATAAAEADGRRAAADRRAVAAEERVQQLLLERRQWKEQWTEINATNTPHQQYHFRPREAQAQAEVWAEELQEEQEQEEEVPYRRQGVRFTSVTLRNPMTAPDIMAASSESVRGAEHSVDHHPVAQGELPQQDYTSPASLFGDDDSFGEGTISTVSEALDSSLHQETTFSNTTASSYWKATRADLGFGDQKERGVKEDDKGEEDESSTSTSAMQEDLDRTRRETERAVQKLLTHPWSSATATAPTAGDQASEVGFAVKRHL